MTLIFEHQRRRLAAFILVAACATSSISAARAESPTLTVQPVNSVLQDALAEASAGLRLTSEASPRDWLAAALSDYRNLLGALYAEGYYGAEISILLNGREAAGLALHDTPTQVSSLDIKVRPGPQFTLGRVSIEPYAPRSEGHALAPGDIARSDVLRDVVSEAAEEWRREGHARPKITQQTITARHREARLDVVVRLDPGPRVRFGQLLGVDDSAVRPDRIRAMAGLQAGAVFDPGHAAEVATRLRRSGAFASVILREVEDLSPEDTLDLVAEIRDSKPRRFGLGAELITPDGARLSGFWLHRNLTGAADRLRFDAEVAQIGGDLGTDWQTSLSYSYPALLGPDSLGILAAQISQIDDPAVQSETVELSAGIEFQLSDREAVSVAGQVRRSRTNDGAAATILSFPTSWSRDRRDKPLDPTSGTYLAATAEPFIAASGRGYGLRSTAEARAYRSLHGGTVAAARFQLGSLMGENTQDILPDDLFYSGGTGTVRGQPYQSLTVGGLGGRSFLGLEAELRTPAPGAFGIVGFVDFGLVAQEPGFGGDTEWHSGAGLGLRYDTGIGPLRLDLAVPVSGDTGAGVQVYIGIGQAL